MHPTVSSEQQGVKSGNHLELVSEILSASPKANPCVVPSAWQNGVFAFGAIYGEEMEGFVVGVVKTNWHNDVA